MTKRLRIPSLTIDCVQPVTKHPSLAIYCVKSVTQHWRSTASNQLQNVWDLIRESKIFIKDKTKVACRMSGIKWIAVYFRKLLFKTNHDEKFSFGRVKSKKICRHPSQVKSSQVAFNNKKAQHSKFTQKKSIETMMMMISVLLRGVETNIQCVYYGYIQLKIRYLDFSKWVSYSNYKYV